MGRLKNVLCIIVGVLFLGAECYGSGVSIWIPSDSPIGEALKEEREQRINEDPYGKAVAAFWHLYKEEPYPDSIRVVYEKLYQEEDILISYVAKNKNEEYCRWCQLYLAGDQRLEKLGNDIKLQGEYKDSSGNVSLLDSSRIVAYSNSNENVYKPISQEVFISEEEANAIIEKGKDNNTESNFNDNIEVIKIVQQKLNELGFDCGNVDGIVGAATKTAVTSFMNAQGLNSDGMITIETLEALGLFDVVSELSDLQEYRSDLIWDNLMRHDSELRGEKITFSGTVFQVINGGAKKLLLSVNGNEDTLVLCNYGRINLPENVLEGDSFQAYGTFDGIEDYISALGTLNSVPELTCDYIRISSGLIKRY